MSCVSFSFPARPEICALSDISLSVAPGQCLALVGPSGAGKSTVLSLLERLYVPQTGTLLVDNIDIAVSDHTPCSEHDTAIHLPMQSTGLQWWRRQLAWVAQDIVLFNRSIRENIAYGCHSDVDQVQIETAAIAANIHSFILSLPLVSNIPGAPSLHCPPPPPQGYNTLVGSRGSQLSGGQKQRIAIARALVRKPKILLLDEATSALDTESEKMVQEALDKARKGRTTIIIAHR